MLARDSCLCRGRAGGWCQYGLKGRVCRASTVTALPRDRGGGECRKVWRITCFVVDRKFRRRGIAGAALRAALKSIATKGGGLVEAFPVENWEGKALEICRRMERCRCSRKRDSRLWRRLEYECGDAKDNLTNARMRKRACRVIWKDVVCVIWEEIVELVEVGWGDVGDRAEFHAIGAQASQW